MTDYSSGTTILMVGRPIGENSGQRMRAGYIGCERTAGFPYFHGDIAEILIYDRLLSGTELQQIQTYLNQKYFQSVQINALVAGGDCTFVVRENATASGWGNNKTGQIGDGTHVSRYVPTPVVSLANVLIISEGEEHALALVQRNLLYTWGNDYFGQLGNGTLTDQRVPQEARGL